MVFISIFAMFMVFTETKTQKYDEKLLSQPMDKLGLLQDLDSKTIFYIKGILGFTISFLLTYITIPAIIKISRRKNLMDEPTIRSSHERKIPNLGGIAIFFSLGVCAPIFAYELFEQYKFLFASLVILFYVGVTDDIVVMRAYKKLLVQIAVSVLMVVGSDVRIRSFFGLFGIEELNYYFSVFFSILTFIILINAFNLIDGIDGLAGSYSVLSSAVFAISFYRLGEYNYPLVVFCIIIIGAVLGFLKFNLSKERSHRIFMGDTGSMILGFLLAFTAIQFIDVFIDKDDIMIPRYHLLSAPVIALSILILPVIDTFSVILIRLFKKQSLFKPDRNHLHHRVLDLGLTHKQATLVICFIYVLVIILVYFLRHLDLNLLFFVVFLLGMFLSILPIILKKILIK
ncbi:MraY family glycosyltransferase [Chryseobacterium sp. POL2]|uniref:glycosyltransferase family 4 protein n=1 Tax=Chryseobacterium sp. POL2 TaxID=2713414 RepID=UPI00293BA60D|nr:MraY family glycosyltransferase [Chryseobacterium sp. POL2]